jgi:hypothetical protein
MEVTTEPHGVLDEPAPLDRVEVGRTRRRSPRNPLL